jgi:hypothetical protein
MRNLKEKSAWIQNSRGRIKLKWIVNQYGVRIWTKFIWLRI